MQKLYSYAKGSSIFTSPQPDGVSRKQLAGTPWPLTVYYDPPLSRQVYASGGNTPPRFSITGQVGLQPASILLDTGTTGTAYISKACCDKLGLNIKHSGS